MKKQIISGVCKIPTKDGSNSFYVFNGDIEHNFDGDMVYVTDGIEGERYIRVKDMNEIAQNYVLNNIKTVNI